MANLKWASIVACVATIALATSNLVAIEITPLSGDYDTWIRQSSPTTSYSDDAISTWTTEGPANTARDGVVQFDLSSVNVPITSAYLEIAPYSSTQTVTLAPAYYVDGSIQSGNLATFAWSDYELFVQPFQSQFEALGSGTFDHLAANAYTNTLVASAADLSALNSIRTDGNGHLITMILASTSGKADWNSTEAGSQPWKLVINQPLPVAGDFNGDGMVNLTDYGVLTSNWLQTVTPGSNGDLDGTGLVDLADFVLFKQDYQAANGFGSGSALAAVPEPASIVLLASILPGWLLLRKKRQSSHLDGN